MKISVEIKAAIIAISIIVLSIWGFNFLKGKNILKSSNEYYALFSRIDGIVESGNVFIKGFKVGNITKVAYDHENSGKFIVRILLEDDIKIPKGTKVIVKTSNLIASAKDLELVLSDSDIILEPGDTLQTGLNQGLSEFIDPITNKIDNVLYQLDSTLNSVNQVFNKQTQMHLQSALKSLDESIYSVNMLLKDGGHLHESIENFNTISGTLASKSGKMGSAIDNLEALTDSLNSADISGTIHNLDSTITNLNQILVKVNDGNGTAGKLINDSALYVNLAQATTSLDSLLVDLKENPKRYVHVSVFGKK